MDTANHLIETIRGTHTLEPIYNGIRDRVAQTVGGNTTNFALDVVGLPEVIQTSDGNSYLHLPGVIVAESAGGEVRYLLSDGLGSVRQAVDEAGEVVASYEFDPYGNPVDNGGGEPYGYTGEWWENEVGLLHLRARWYAPETGTFLSRDPFPGYVEWPQTFNPYPYSTNNPVTLNDPGGQQVSAEAIRIIDRIVRGDLDGRIHGGLYALIELFETDELDPYDPPASNTAKARLELILEATNKLLPRGIDAGLHFAIDFNTCGLQGQFNDEWLYREYWNQNPDDPNVANQIGHFLTAVRLGYDPTFLLIPQFYAYPFPQIRPFLPMTNGEDIYVTAKRFIVGHEMKGDPAPTGSPAGDAILTGRNIPKQYNAAKPRDVDYFDKAVDADRLWISSLRDYYLRQILGSMTYSELRRRQGNSMEDLRLSVKGWRLGRAVAGLDGNAQPPEKSLTTRFEVSGWLRIHLFHMAEISSNPQVVGR